MEMKASMARSNGNGTSRKYGHACLIAQSLDVLGDRWTLLLLRDLMTGLRRYTDILQNCPGLSPNVLADRLKMLEREGLVHRHYERGLPPRVEYTLTEKGWSVRPILLSLVEWGMTYANRFTRESVGDTVPTDFAVRMVPTFAFQPELAEGVNVSLMLEIDDCEGCSAWTFQIDDGRLIPQRGGAPSDLHFRTDTRGFFRFFRGTDPGECGELRGPVELAKSFQSCFELAPPVPVEA